MAKFGPSFVPREELGHYPYWRIFADYASALADGSCIVAHGVDVPKAQLMKTERSESHHEATKALALAIAGVASIILFWHLIMLLFY